MKQHRITHAVRMVAAVLCLWTALPAMSQQTKGLKGEAADPDTLLSANEKGGNYFFLEAVRAHNNDENDKALAMLDSCLKHDRNAAAAYFYRARIYIEQGKDSLALPEMEKATALSPANKDYKGLLGYCYLKASQGEKAIATYEWLANETKSDTKVLSILLALYRQEDRYDKIIDVINRLEAIEGTSEYYTLGKMQAYEKKGDKKAAYETLKRFADANSAEPDYQLMLGNWLMQNDGQKEAYRIYRKVLQDDPENAQALESIYDYYKAVGNESMAQETQNNILLSRQTPYQTKENIFKRLIEENEKTHADSTVLLTLLDKMMAAAAPENVEIAELKVAYMMLKQMPQDSIQAQLRSILQAHPDRANVRFELVKAAWDAQQWNKVVALCQEGIRLSPNFMAFYYFCGLADVQQDKNEEALSTLLKGVSKENKESDAKIVADFYAIIGDLYEKQGQSHKAFEAYEQCLERNPEHINALNNYAYYLSERGGDLEKAARMSLKTVTAEPENGTYLDTYAWILFMQKRYEDAQTFIDRALAAMSPTEVSGTVLEHAGDIYACTKNIEKALEYWQKALKAGADSPVLRTKIKTKKYIKSTK